MDAIDPPAVSGIVIAVVVIDQSQFAVVHLAAPLHRLDETARAGHGPIGRVVVSCRDRSPRVEDFRHILVEVPSIAVKRGGLHQGQGTRGHRFQRIPQQCPKHVPAVEHVQGSYLEVATVQVAFMAGDRSVDGDLLHVAASLVVVAAFHHRTAVPAGEAHRAVGRVVHDRPDTR